MQNWHYRAAFFPNSASVVLTLARAKGLAWASSQHASESRVIFSPFRLPSTVTAIASGLNSSWADCCTVFGGDRLDALNDLVHADEAVVVHFLPRQVRHARGRRLQAQHQAALELVLAALQLFFRERHVLEVAELLQRPTCTTLGADSRDVPAYTDSNPCRGKDSARRRWSTPVPASRARSETAANSCRRPAACSARTRRSAAWWLIRYDGTPRQICTCSSDFLLRRVMRDEDLRRVVVPAVRARLQMLEALAQQIDNLVVLDVSRRRDDQVSGNELACRNPPGSPPDRSAAPSPWFPGSACPGDGP